MADKIDDGGPAFPTLSPPMSCIHDGVVEIDAGSERMPPGMSLRDWFAGCSLYIASFNFERLPTSAPLVADRAYAIADAMLAARQKGGAS